MMKRTLLCFLVCLLQVVTATYLQPQAQPAQQREWTGTTEQKLWGLMTVWAETKYGFPYVEKLQKLDWDKKAREYIPAVMAAKDVESYYRVLMELVTLLQDSHTSVMPPWGYFKPGFDMPPVEVKVIGDKFYVFKAGEADEIKSQRISPGLEILEVEHVPVREYFKKNVLKFNTRGSKQADDALLVIYLLYGPKDGKVKLKVKDTGGAVRTVTLTRNSMCKNNLPFMYGFVKSSFVAQTIVSKMLPGGILYVDIPNFEKDRVQVDFRKLIDTVDAKEVKGMIVDVRNNLGGSSTICRKIVSCLIDKPVKTPSMNYPHYIAAHKAWGKEPVWSSVHNEIKPREGKRYLGPLVVLTGPLTNSSAEDLVIELQQNGRAKIVGEKTTGGAGNKLVSNLPGGGKFMLATFKATYPDGREYIGIGITPDIPVAPTPQDIVKGNDAVLEKGIEVIKNMK